MKRETIITEVEESKTEIDRLHKCLSVTQYRLVSQDTFDINLNNYIESYNYITKLFKKYYDKFTTEHKQLATEHLTKLRDKTERLFKTLDINIEVSPELQILDRDNTIILPENMAMKPEDFLGLAARQIPKNYNGARTAFINSIRLLEKISKGTNDDILLSFLMTKLVGKAVEVVPTEPTNIEDIIKGLLEIKPESSKVVSSKMTSLRFDRGKITDFSEQATKLSEALQRSLVIEGVTQDKAKEMVIDKTIEMCRGNARSDLVKAVLSATTYTSPDEVIAKLILESSKETQEKQVMAYRANNRNNNHRNRGRGGHNNFNNDRRQLRYNNSGYNQGYQGKKNAWYRGNRGRGRGNYQHQSVRVIEASGNEETPQHYQQLGETALTPYRPC